MRDGFPAEFVWGAATAAYQVEGAVGEDGRGESIWDRFAHEPGRVAGGDTGDVACDHYHRYREDVALVASLGLQAYRFSVAWPRVMPDGAGQVNTAGLDFYDRLVDELCASGIQPHATLYHWDLPQALEDAGGWPERRIADAFAGYADVVARRLGDRLASLATINEPWCAATMGYLTGEHAPGRCDPAAARAAGHHLLVAHGLAVAAIRAASPATPVGIVLNFEPKRPASGHPLDLEAAADEHDRFNRWYLDPIAGRGYPEQAVQRLGWGREEVRDGDLDLIAAPLDFLGVNYYTSRTVRSSLLPPPAVVEVVEQTDMGWTVDPSGLTEVLELVGSRDARCRSTSWRAGRPTPATRATPRATPPACRTCGATSRPRARRSHGGSPSGATSRGPCSTTSSGIRGTGHGSASWTWTSRRRSGGSGTAGATGRRSRRRAGKRPRCERHRRQRRRRTRRDSPGRIGRRRRRPSPGGRAATRSSRATSCRARTASSTPPSCPSATGSPACSASTIPSGR